MTDTSVFVELPGGETVLAGWIHFQINPGEYKPTINFEYAQDYLGAPGAYAFSPDLPLNAGYQSAPMQRETFMALADVQPDSWGRRLLQSESRRAAREAGIRWEPPTGLDLLLAVPDITRQGALRFKADPSGPFVSEVNTRVPSVVDLEDLVAAAERFERGDYDLDDTSIRQLVQVGTTQGGARPKAIVEDDEGRLAIAKLPHPEDRWDVMRWEAVALQLAADSGIETPPFKLHSLSDFRAVLTVTRFDRTPTGGRIGYLSAKGLMLADDGAPVDYTLLADHLTEISASPTHDAEQLFRRVALSLLVSNVDDHMRNHGLLRGAAGWRISPVFDVNPFPMETGVDSTPVSPEDDPYSRDLRLLIENCGHFRLTTARAARIIREVELASAEWAHVAGRFGVEHDSIARMARAFENENRDRARAIADQLPGSAADSDERTPAGSSSRWVPAHIRNGKPVKGYLRGTGQAR
ncbi:type II toxin-antitoxin system HipA family toxin [Gryllotalpicola reticulitermitis]|uniref:Type II toxin-antitoxin system HipA family toxin n=1 Tax=Gryllotalpicola reticulitermitis TaxID=1184153 RepID=A0ABV8Q6Q9_9MICO